MIFLGLTAQGEDEKKDVEQFVKDHKIKYSSGWGCTSEDAFGIEAYPTLFVVGGDGKIVWVTGSEGSFKEAIDKALAAIKKE